VRKIASFPWKRESRKRVNILDSRCLGSDGAAE
jgi:hypothetical protein